MNREDQVKKMHKIIAKAWADEAFKQKLLTDTAAVLKAEGMEIPDGVEVKIMENTDKLIHLVLPVKPSSGELSEDMLEKVAGGCPDPLGIWP